MENERRNLDPPGIVMLAVVLGMVTIWAVNTGNVVIALIAGTVAVLALAMWLAGRYIRERR